MTTDLTTALGRLLTDATLRSRFFLNRAAMVEQLGLEPSSAGVLQQLDEESFEQQAQGLIDKRFREVARLVPATMRQLGSNASQFFRAYAVDFWPETHRRHVIDAVEFCQHLRNRYPGTVCRSEQHRVEFRLSRRLFAVHFLSGYYVNDKRHLAIQFLARSNTGLPIESVRYLRFPVRLFRRKSRT